MAIEKMCIHGKDTEMMRNENLEESRIPGGEGSITFAGIVSVGREANSGSSVLVGNLSSLFLRTKTSTSWKKASGLACSSRQALLGNFGAHKVP